MFLQFRQIFKGLRVSNHKVRVSNYLVRASNPPLVIPKKFSAARGEKVRGLAELIKYAVACSDRACSPGGEGCSDANVSIWSVFDSILFHNSLHVYRVA